MDKHIPGPLVDQTRDAIALILAMHRKDADAWDELMEPYRGDADKLDKLLRVVLVMSAHIGDVLAREQDLKLESMLTGIARDLAGEG
jgi:hypothetical protein